MAGRYFAITRQDAEWIYVCSGVDPVNVYHDACDILQGSAAWHGDEPVALSPRTEHLLDHLRVVPDTVARERYQVRFRPAVHRESDS